MRRVTIINKTRPAALVEALYCESFLCQLRGLTFRRSLSPEEGLLLVQKQDSRIEAAIHMLFMWIDLTVVWVNRAGQVVDVRLARRWRSFYVPKLPASYVLEIHTDRIHDFQVGDQVEIRSNDVGK